MTIWNELKQKNQRLFLQFAGHGGDCLKELTHIYSYPQMKEYFDFIFQLINEELQAEVVKKAGLHRLGFNLKAWLENQEQIDELYLQEAMITAPLTFITQIAYYHLLQLTTISANELMELTYAVTGYSQGMIPAVFVALNLQGDDYWRGIKNHFKLAFYIGFSITSFGLKLHQKPAAQGTPMLSLKGITRGELDTLLAGFSQNRELADTVVLSIVCTEIMYLVTGKPEVLLTFMNQNQSFIEQNRIMVNYLPFVEPFHHPMLSEGAQFLNRCLNDFNYPYQGADLCLPVYSSYDGANLQQDPNLGQTIGHLNIDVQTNWPECIHQIKSKTELGAVIDLGPGITSSLFTREILMDNEIEIYTISRKKHFKNLVAV